MRARIRISSLVPSGLVIESLSDSSDSIIIAVRAESCVAECPLCGARSSRIHSRYDRQAADLPCAGKEIRICKLAAAGSLPASTTNAAAGAKRLINDVQVWEQRIIH